MKDLVDEEYSFHRVLMCSVLKRAMERMDSILNDISKKKPYRCRSVLKSYSVCCIRSSSSTHRNSGTPKEEGSQ